MIARIRVGWETMIIGPRAEFAGLVDGNPSTADPLSSEYEVRRCLTIALHDPAIANNVRRSFGQWTNDGHRIQEANDRSLIDRVARMTRNGTLIAFVIAEASMKSRRADMSAELPARPEAPDIKVSVDAMTLQQRTVRVLSLTPDFLVGGAREEFARLLTPETLPLSAGVLSAWAASHVLSLG
jgi:hypothetical protein